MKASLTSKNLAWTVGLSALPFVIYAIERKIGVLPSAEAWYATKTNHGPWRWGLEGFTVFYPVLILLVVTVIKIIAPAVREKNRKLMMSGLGLIVLQLIGLFLQLSFLSWTVG